MCFSYFPAIEVFSFPPAFEAHAREMAGMARQVLPELRRYNVKWGSEIHAPMPPEALLNFAKQVNDEYVGLVTLLLASREQKT